MLIGTKRVLFLRAKTSFKQKKLKKMIGNPSSSVMCGISVDKSWFANKDKCFGSMIAILQNICDI